jgi:thiamine-phosphate pyrophosphorylase
MKELPRLYAIADASFGDTVALAKSLFDGGARLIQIRNKKAPAGQFLDEIERVLAFAPPDAQVIVNDRADIALVSGAAGVHLGQTDIPAAAAREMLGPDRIIGVSTHNLNQALEADKLPIDYIAVGPVFPTATKENAEPVLGVEALAGIRKVVEKPIVAVGGITLENAPAVLEAGAHSIAVISDLLKAGDIAKRVREWGRLLQSFG